MNDSTEKLILLIDDEPEMLNLAQSILESEGMKTITAENGEEGIKLLNNGINPDLIITDIRMPKMNGVQFLESYRKRQDGTRPVILLTGHLDPAIEENYKTQFDGVIYKPFKIIQMINSVKSLLNIP